MLKTEEAEGWGVLMRLRDIYMYSLYRRCLRCPGTLTGLIQLSNVSLRASGSSRKAGGKKGTRVIPMTSKAPILGGRPASGRQFGRAKWAPVRYTLFELVRLFISQRGTWTSAGFVHPPEPPSYSTHVQYGPYA